MFFDIYIHMVLIDKFKQHIGSIFSTITCPPLCSDIMCPAVKSFAFIIVFLQHKQGACYIFSNISIPRIIFYFLGIFFTRR